MAFTKKDEETKEVTTQTTGGVPATLNYGDYEGQGFEDQDASHLAIPFINLLQAISPQVMDDNPVGAKAGKLLNSVTLDMYDGDKGIEFVPGLIEHVVVEWVPRDSGGGFVGIHDLQSDVVKEAKERARQTAEPMKLKAANGNDLIETFYMYGAQIEGDDPLGMAIIAFTSTKIQSYKRWNTKINLFPHKRHGMASRPPLFAHRIRITSTKEKRKKGDSFNFVLTPAVEGDVFKSLLRPDSECFQAALRVREMVIEGAARAAYDTADTGDKVAGGTDEVPF